MIQSIGLRLFGITDEASYIAFERSFVKVEKPEQTLTEIRTQSHEGRCQPLGPEGIEIDGVIQISQFHKIRALWNSVELKSQRATYGFLALIPASLAWGVYCHARKGEVLTTVISLVVGIVSGFFYLPSAPDLYISKSNA